MNPRTKLSLAFLLFAFSINCSFGKPVINLKKIADTTFIFKDDTLFSNIGFKIFVGQNLIIGKGSEGNGCYQAISFKSPIALPILLFRKTETANNLEYQVDPSQRDKDKVKEYLNIGQSLTVTKIKSQGNGKKWHYYLVYLADGTSSLSTKFKVDIAYALKLKELLIQ